MKKSVVISACLASALMASGYKIPEVSTNGVALGAANIAHGHGADSAYYNPANMVFMDDAQQLEADLIYIGLQKVHYEGSVSNGTPSSFDSKSEDFFIPALHYVSPKLGENNVRVGLSVNVPGGLTKRWVDSPAQQYAQEFTLEIVEINPTMAIPLGEHLAIAFGLRVVDTSGVVQSSGLVSRDMTGESIDLGYNLALAYKPTPQLEIGATYRSKVNLTVDGNAKLYGVTQLQYDGGVSVSVPLPATASLAVAYTFDTSTTVEVVYERDMWSAYQELDFNYVGNVGNLAPYFDAPIPKNWKDTTVYRIGITQELEQWTLMAGCVIDESPIPQSSLSFELPGSDTLSFSLGARYQYNEHINVGISALYSMHDARDVQNDTLDGKFSEGDVTIVSAGLQYKF